MTPANPHRGIGGLFRLRFSPFNRLLLVVKITPESDRWLVNAMADLVVRASWWMDRNVVVVTNPGMIVANPPLRVIVVGCLSIDID